MRLRQLNSIFLTFIRTLSPWQQRHFPSQILQLILLQTLKRTTQVQQRRKLKHYKQNPKPTTKLASLVKFQRKPNTSTTNKGKAVPEAIVWRRQRGAGLDLAVTTWMELPTRTRRKRRTPREERISDLGGANLRSGKKIRKMIERNGLDLTTDFAMATGRGARWGRRSLTREEWSETTKTQQKGCVADSEWRSNCNVDN